MDNLCHTLVGAAIGETGLKRRTRFGTVTLLVASNLPDLDVLVFATSVPSVAFRRGWTHGVLAQLLLPVALTAAVTLFARTRAGAHADGNPQRVSVPWLLALSYAGLFSHVFLDYLNNYGIRLLAPFDWRWFYGDAVFIVDVWLWILLGAGVWLARRRGWRRAAAVSLAMAVAYIAFMLVSARAARATVRDAWQARGGGAAIAVMAGPVPVSPFRRSVIVDAGDHYATGRYTWPSRVSFDPALVPKNADGAAVAQARMAADVRGFLVWSRFPQWEIQAVPGGTRVTVRDMRFGETFSATAIVPDAIARRRHPQ